MENIRKEAALLIERINLRGGVVYKDEKRRLVELRNELCEGKVSYNVGCQTCIKKSYAHLEKYFKENPIVEVKKKTKKDENVQTKEGGEQEKPQKKDRRGRKPKADNKESAE